MKSNLSELTPLAPLDMAAPASDGLETFKPENVCSRMIRYKVEKGRLTRLDFTGGCDGNLKAIAALVEGMKVEDVVDKLKGITCGKKDTSCVDQLCVALLGAAN
ncbi:MAG TPA: TIGR03905 family TSCPD domain-containing protein [Pseudodesulfovibrio sp.]|nr:TIGR03905 family TSCPD domain-containing protein [Pseudodesulfovibrio sp.]